MSHTNFDRRRVLIGGASALGAAAIAGACAKRAPPNPSAANSELILVLLELAGGVDGLSTAVPFRADEYHRARPTTRLDESSVLPIRDDRGLHHSLANLHARFEKGEVALIEGCGYPEPAYSHFRAAEVWHTARRAGRVSGEGWIGRLRRAAWPDRTEPELVVHLGNEMPWSVSCESRPPLVFGAAENFRALGRLRDVRTVGWMEKAAAAPRPTVAKPRDVLLSAMRRTLSTSTTVAERLQNAVERYRPHAAYPDLYLARKFYTIAAMIDAGFETRVYSVSHTNYDSHGAVQKQLYTDLHAKLDRSLEAFLSDLAQSSRGRNVVVLAFSEFGRRFHENESRGTDHGAAGPMWLIGPKVRGGMYGAHPSLTEPDENDNLVYTTDFRRVYASVIEQGFGVASESVLGERWEPLPLLST